MAKKTGTSYVLAMMRDVIARAVKGDYTVSIDTSSIDDSILFDLAESINSIITAFKDKDKKNRVVEEELASRDQFLNSIVEKNPYPLWIFNEAGDTIRLNQACCDLFKISKDDVVGKYNIFKDKVIKEQGLDLLLKNLCKKDETIHFTLEYDSSKDFSTFFINNINVILEATAFSIQDYTRGFKSIVIIFRDITRHTEDLELLRKNRRLLNEAEALAHLGSWEWDPRNSIGYWSEELYRIFGQESGPFEVNPGNEPFVSLIHPDDRDRIINSMLNTVKNRAPYKEEYRIVRPDGKVRYLSSTGVAFLNKRGRVDRMVGAVFDITDQKAAEEKLKESNRLLLESQRVARLGHFIIDVVNLNWHSSEVLDEIFGIDNSFVKDREGWFSLIYEEDRDYVLKVLQDNVNNTGQPFDIEYRMKRFNDQQIVWVHNLGNVEHDSSGRPERIIGTIQDVTNRKQLEQQLAQSHKMEAIGQLAGGIAHDCNNMLGVILGYSELLKMKMNGSEDVLDEINEIQKAASHSRDITRQLLAFSRKQIIEPKTIGLNDLVKRSQNTIARLINEDIILDFKPGKNIGLVRIDPSQIDQIIMNIVINARDAMPDGGNLNIETADVQLDEDFCKQHIGSYPGTYVKLSISDSGIGMDADVVSHIFEPFFTTKAMGKGTGLGLAVVYGIVKQNNGYIDVISSPGKGTTFEIYFPQVFDKIALESPEKHLKKASIEETIMIVEDDDMVREMTANMLIKIGYKVLSYEDPLEALRCFDDVDFNIDLLLTDVVMPGLKGTELSEKIIEKRPDLKVLFMSGYTANVIAHHGVLEEGVNFIQKPFSLHDLSSKIREIIDNQ